MLPMLRRWSRHLIRSPEAAVVAAFGATILAGTALLSLPWAHDGGVGLLGAFFTATSAVCVTGLIVVDTGTAYTPFGQGVVLLLIQLGGLGIMTYAALLFALLGRRISLRSQSLLEDALFQRNAGSAFRPLFFGILKLTLLLEGMGAVLLWMAFRRHGLPLSEAVWPAVFHAVSAFCNAGFSIYATSLVTFGDDGVLMGIVSALIVLGGLGHSVLLELWRNATRRLSRFSPESPHRFSYHAKVVLWTSGVLLGGGTILLLAFGTGGGTGRFDLPDALFQSVTARTAGFNSVPMDLLPPASLFLLLLLMIVGGSPGSCAGGMKTTTAAVWLAGVWSRLRRKGETRLGGRGLPVALTDQANQVVALCLLWNTMGLFLLLVTEPDAAFADLLFEQVSAFGTVGLSRGATASLSVAGQLWIAATMFVGRLGPLTLATWVVAQDRVHVRYPEGRVMIG